MSFDIAIVGAGIAGASLAWQLARRARVLLLEAEIQPDLHSTGRSAAMFMESYGPPQVRALTRASRAFYEQPPEGFASSPLVSPRGALYVAWQGQQAELNALQAELQGTGCSVQRLLAADALQRVPVLRAQGLLAALLEPDALDIDVNALHQGWLRGARRAGAELWIEAKLQQAERSADSWRLQLADGRQLQAGVIVDAAGAWADEVAQRCGVSPLGIQPKRRSAFTFDAPPGLDFRAWPVVASVAEDWYLKPEAGQLLGSPANADPVPPHDVQPEELDIARAIAAIERDTTLTIRRPRRSWAGLRSFAPDGELVVGFDVQAAGFFWLAGQGGYGIQSAEGSSRLARALLLGQPLTDDLKPIDLAALSPARLQR
ncbi:MAG: FAD-binding oxidoreductase [Rubrivivax sp.]|nr:FAD-binding oxidoreductase [Rubrivivax sp.]